MSRVDEAAIRARLQKTSQTVAPDKPYDELSALKRLIPGIRRIFEYTRLLKPLYTSTVQTDLDTLEKAASIPYAKGLALHSAARMFVRNNATGTAATLISALRSVAAAIETAAVSEAPVATPSAGASRYTAGPTATTAPSGTPAPRVSGASAPPTFFDIFHLSAGDLQREWTMWQNVCNIGPEPMLFPDAQAMACGILYRNRERLTVLTGAFTLRDRQTVHAQWRNTRVYDENIYVSTLLYTWLWSAAQIAGPEQRLFEAYRRETAPIFLQMNGHNDAMLTIGESMRWIALESVLPPLRRWADAHQLSGATIESNLRRRLRLDTPRLGIHDTHAVLMQTCDLYRDFNVPHRRISILQELARG